MPIVEMTAIVPDKKFNPKVFEREVKRALEAEIRTDHRLYKWIWRSWDGAEPKMEEEIVVNESEAYGEVATQDDTEGNRKLGWLDEGVGPRDIVSGKGLMKFQVEYRARTRPGSILGGNKSKHGEWRSGYVVRNHEIAARKFSETIVKIRRKPFESAITAAFDKAAKEL
jgi:hypothetical protein